MRLSLSASVSVLALLAASACSPAAEDTSSSAPAAIESVAAEPDAKEAEMTEAAAAPDTTASATSGSAMSGVETAAAPAAGDGSVLTADWTGPYGGVPPFNAVEVSQFKPAMEAAMAAHMAEIGAIASSAEPANFENTIVALERSGKALDRASTAYGIWGSNMSSDDFQVVEREIDPMFASHYDKIIQNAALFARVAAVYEGEAYKALNAEQQRLAWSTYNDFVRAGAKLDDAQKARLSEINLRLATLYTNFSQNVLADEEDYVLYLTADDLAGLPESITAGMAAAAAERGKEGAFAITNTRSSMEPFLTYSDRRDLREQVWKTYYSRGDNGDAKDNNAIIAEILKLRFERAQLLGYASHAHWRLEVAMAKTPENAVALMESVWPAAIARVAEEVADMQKIADSEGAGITIEPWDYRYYAEKVRKSKYDLDFNLVKPYMELESLREGMFWVAGELFNFDFQPISDVPVYHPDVRVWEVKDKTTGAHIGLWYFDPYARPGKRSGAWMNAYRNQSRFEGEVKTIVSNNSNFVKGAEGEPVLISWDDASTLFHEFGHALHGLSSNVTYPSLSGTSVARDYVEFPSQLLEHWLSTPEVLSKYALHHETGEPIPQALVDKIEAASTFNEGFATTEYLASALIDMKLHLAGGADIDPDAFERDELEKLGMPKTIVMRHRTPQFAHVFSGDGYSAGYYSYLWSDTLTADAAEAFKEAPGGFYDKGVAAKLVANVFAVGDTIDPADGFRGFRGRDVDTAALMRKRGFPVTSEAPAEPVAAEPAESGGGQ